MLAPDQVGVSIDSSKGFYVRSLARDVGEELGCAATLDSLQRTRVGRFLLVEAVTLDALEGPEGVALAAESLQSLDEALSHLRRVAIGRGDAEALRLGRQSALLRIEPGESGERIRLAAGNELVAVAAYEGRLWVLERVFAAPPQSLKSCSAGPYVLPAAVSQMEEEERNEANHRD